MTKSPFAIRASVALVALACVAPPTAIARPPFAEGRILVKPAPGLSEEKLDKILEKVGGKAARRLERIGVRIVEVPTGKELELVNKLLKHPNVAFAEPDPLLSPVAVVNDPYYTQYQWHLPLMGVPTAWQYGTGQGVTVAVCDTGVNGSHPDLVGQLVAGRNVVSDSSDTSDIMGHGTAVAGVIAAVTNNSIGGASVAPQSRVMPIRITNQSDGFAYGSDMAECVTWAADHGARVANLSYSGAAGSSTMWSAGSYLMSKGGILVVAAANDGTDLGYSNSPYVFVAAATESNDARASYSNYGAYVDIAAPGSNVFTTNSSGGYSLVYGTSFATPNAAAVAALVMSANPALTPTDVLSIITNTAVDLGDAGWDPYYGHGRVDAGAAVAMAATVQTSDRTAPDVSVANPGSGATVKDLVTVEVQATDAFGVTNVEFLVDGAVVASDTQEDPASPYVYRFAWDSTQASDGKHTMSARAKDAAGNVGSAQAITVNVANNDDITPPTFTSRTPASGAVVSGVMTMSASASDNVAVANVSISGGGVSCSGTTSASCNLNTRKIPGGTTIPITFTATDTAGNTATEQSSVVVCCAATDTTTNDTTTPDTSTKVPPGLKKK